MSSQSVSGNTTYPALVGNIIAQLRKERGFGQAEFAAMVGLGQSTWSRIEKGESALTVEQLAKTAEQLEIKPHELLVLVDGARDNLQAQGIGTLLDRIGVGNMALLGSIPVVGPTLTAVLSGISTFQKYNTIQREIHHQKEEEQGEDEAEETGKNEEGSEENKVSELESVQEPVQKIKKAVRQKKAVAKKSVDE